MSLKTLFKISVSVDWFLDYLTTLFQLQKLYTV